jgi:hypothetical protein
VALSTVSSLNGLFNTIYEDALFVARDMNLMSNLVTPYSGTGFMNRVIPQYPTISAQEKAEGVDYANATQWTKTTAATLTPKTIFTQTILTDERRSTDPEDAQASASREMGGAIATKIDEDLVGLFPSFTTDKGSAGAALTLAKCSAALAVLRNTKVMGPFQYVLHPYGWHDIWTELGQPAATYQFLGDVANQAMRDYAVGQFLGATWYTSANISVDASDDAVSAVFTREALALDTRVAPTLEPERDASNLAWELNMHAAYAVAVRRATYGIKLTHDAAEPS